MASKQTDVLTDPLINNNPIALQVLGICSALAVTGKMETSFVLSVCVVLVTGFTVDGVVDGDFIVHTVRRTITVFTVIREDLCGVDERAVGTGAHFGLDLDRAATTCRQRAQQGRGRCMRGTVIVPERIGTTVNEG